MDPNMSYHRLYAAPPSRSELCLSQLTDGPHDVLATSPSPPPSTAHTPSSPPPSTAPTRDLPPLLSKPTNTTKKPPFKPPRIITYTCISDTHNTTPFIPYSDVLLHAGDLTNQGSYTELKKQLDWLASLPHELKIIIAGNHDSLTLDAEFHKEFGVHIKYKYPTPQNPAVNRALFGQYEDRGVRYLEHEMRQFKLRDGREFSVFGSPWIPNCGGYGFSYDRDGLKAKELWKEIPEGVDVLLTHTPSRFIVDSMKMPGCEELRKRVEMTRPRLHVMGHVHEAFGVVRVRWEEMNSRSTATVGRGEVEEDAGKRTKVWRVQARNGEGGLKRETVCVNAAMKGGGRKTILVGMEMAVG